MDPRHGPRDCARKGRLQRNIGKDLWMPGYGRRRRPQCRVDGGGHCRDCNRELGVPDNGRVMQGPWRAWLGGICGAASLAADCSAAARRRDPYRVVHHRLIIVVHNGIQGSCRLPSGHATGAGLRSRAASHSTAFGQGAAPSSGKLSTPHAGLAQGGPVTPSLLRFFALGG